MGITMKQNESKILIFGGTGYIGSHMVKASIKLGHPTYVFTRPDSDKKDLIREFQSMGAIIIKGRVEEHDKLVEALREVDIVISALAYPQVLDQLKILEAIKIAGNIKRFLPSDFGVEEDRVSALPPFEAFLDKKRRIRRAIEEAKIPYTFISANCYGSYFINYLLNPSHPNKQEITVYGSGEAKAVLNYEQDIGMYTIKVATDPRMHNRIVIFRPSENAVSQLELISLWEKKTGKIFKKTHISEEEIVTLSQTLPDPQNIPVSILHSVFVKGATADFEIGGDDVEASSLYPDLKFSTVDEMLDVFLKNPPKPASAAFE
ncbi:eugenol synthase 1-like [Salvia splendens]|nr:eugenol synthase 1-like [Salvia splendens]